MLRAIFRRTYNKVVFSASYSKNGLEQAKLIQFKDVHYKSKNLAEESRYTVSLINVRVALICSCGKC